MKSQVIAVIAGFLVLLFLVGCGQPDASSSSPTATSDSDSAPPYAEIRAMLMSIEAETRNAIDQTTSSEELTAVMVDGNRRTEDYFATLWGKKIHDWHAWLAYTEKDEATATYNMHILYNDPFSKILKTLEYSYLAIFPLNGNDFSELRGLGESQIRDYKIGQEIVFNGVITQTSKYRSLDLEVSKIEPVAEATPTLMPSQDLKDVVITLDRGPCFVRCRRYTLEIHGDGKVIYNGAGGWRSGGMTRGTIESTISQEKVAELLAFFDKVNYFSLNDEYMDDSSGDASVFRTSLTLGDKHKGVNHNQGNGSAPVKLRLLEDKIDEIANTDQWINKGSESKSQGPTNP